MRTTRQHRGLELALALALFPIFDARAEVEFAPCKNHFSPEQQIELGEKARQVVYRQMPVLSDSSAVTQYVRQLGERLTAVAPGHKWPYNFHVANVADVNAFALPGGTVFVNVGAIQAAENEAQLAGVMAHEISHVVLQHSVCNAEKERRVGLLAGLGQVAAAVVLGGAAGDIAAQGIGLTAGLGFLKMSRAAERQADLEGAKIAYNAGFDPRGLAQFFSMIEAKYGARGSQFTSDHPNPGNRTEYVEKEIASFPPRTDLVKTSLEFERVKDAVIVMHAYTAREVASGVWRSQGADRLDGTR
jgi:beta-barrel assembly-enhancing protease